MDDAFVRHYGAGIERDRLTSAGDSVELARTLELLAQALPAPPARVLDVGGGPGVYAARLARDGYAVRLIDVVPLHVEEALALAAVQAEAPFDAEVGDARDLSHVQDESVDAVLVLGPLYHLTERDQRVQVLTEARRVARVGGVVVAVGISRYASLLDGAIRGFIDDPRFLEIVERDLRDGQHRNPANVEGWFTTAYFHLPGDLWAEVEQAGLTVDRLVGVEGPLGWLGEWPEHKDRILRVARLAEPIPAMSPHMLCIARRLE